MRKYVYDKAIETGQYENGRAVMLCSIFRNAYYMGCTYPEEVLTESKKFWPREAIENPLFVLNDD